MMKIVHNLSILLLTVLFNKGKDMKKLLLATAMLGLFSSAIAAEYKLDPSHTNARFNIDHFQTSTNHGGFYGIDGVVQFDAQAKTGALDITIKTNTLNTGSKDFDGHMSSSDLLNVESFPEINFKSTKWVFDGNKPTEITGELTMMGKTHPVTLTATKFNCYENPMFNAEVCGGDFTTTIDRTLWGIDFLVDAGIPKEVELKIQVEAVKQ